jgi:hypothetical protein
MYRPTFARALTSALLCMLLAACGGGSSTPAVSTAGAASSAATAGNQQIAIHLKIDTVAVTAANARTPQYVSPATNGVLVQVYTSPQSANPTVVSSSITDVSPGSTACGSASATRSCTITIPAPVGTDDFVFTTYDTAPVSGAFASSAKILAIGRVTQAIAIGQTNTVNVSLSGVIATLRVMPASQTLVSGTATSYNLAISALDADGYTIIAGASDPYNSPITVTRAESGGIGVTSLTTGGSTGTGSNSVTLSQSTTIATVLYTGVATSGYSAQFTVAAQGATSVVSTFVPLNVSPASINFSVLAQTAQVTLNEANFTGSFTLVSDSCSPHIATSNDSAPLVATSGSATLTITGVAYGSCAIVVSDGTTNATISVTVSASASTTVTIPGVANFSSTGAPVTYMIPARARYHIVASGGQGGCNAISCGGSGATVSGDFILPSGDQIAVYVGGVGSTGAGGGGGGGTFIFDVTTSTLLVAAAGGGGAGKIGEFVIPEPGGAGLATTAGAAGGQGYDFAGGSSGTGGLGGGGYNGGGGGGFLTPGSGAGGSYGGSGGGTFPGFSGGTSELGDSGGFGGGGGPSVGGGGGGGYSGGGGGAGIANLASGETGDGGGGGGSYLAPAAINAVLLSGVQSGNGAASVTQLQGS